MNKTLLTGVMLSSLFLLVAPGCREESNFAGSDTGRIYLGLDFQADPLVSGSAEASRASGAPKTAITVDDLQLTLSSNDREWERTYSSIAEFNAESSFPTGDYTLKAFYGTSKDEGFAKPYYTGQTDFTIHHDQTTEVSFPVRLANSIVDVKVSDAFASYMKQYSFSIVSSAGTSHTWIDAQEEDLYVPAGTTKVLVSFVKPSGVEARNFEVATFTAKPRYRHTVTIDYNAGEVGGTESLTFDFDDAVEEADGEIDITDETLNQPAPTMQIDLKRHDGTPTTGSRREFVEGCPDVSIAAFNIEARGGIQHVNLTTESAGLLSLGWPAQVDLCYPGEYEAKLKELGIHLLGVSERRDVMGVVGLNDVFANIPYIEGGNNTSKFTVSVTDWNGKTSETPLTLTAVVTPLIFEIQSANFTSFDDIDVVFKFNGNHDSLHSLQFMAQKTIGSQHDRCPIRSAEEGDDDIFTADLEYDYNYFLEGEGYTLYAKAGPYQTEPIEITVNHADLTVVAAPENVFAKYAIVKLEGVPAGAQGAKFQISTDNKMFEAKAATAVSGQPGYYRIANLNPSTTYWIRANAGDAISRRASFTTEADAQIPNGNLDAPTSNPRNIPHLQLFEGWGTNNTMTTDFTAMFGVTAEYVKTSGTVQTSDATKGSAALVRTIGWGSGNTNAGGSSKIAYIDPGLLHLGAERSSRASNIFDTSDLDCGIVFNSRPMSVTFKYKYTAVKSEDQGEALVRIYDSAGAIIFEKIFVIKAEPSYTEGRIDVVYPLNTSKAGKLYIRFLSSTKTPQSKGIGDNINGWINFGSPHLGSQLWIDEVTLNY